VVEGRGLYCLNVGAMQIDEAISRSLLAALTPLGVEAALAAAERLEADRDGALAHWRHAVERATYEERRAQRRYMAVDPDNRLVARGLEAEREQSLRDLETAKAELARREQEQPRTLGPDQRDRLLALGADLRVVWDASATSFRDKKELLRTVLEEVIVSVQKQERRAHLTLRWRGGALTETTLDLPRLRPAIVKTDEDTIALVRRLAAHYPDPIIAGVLNRQGRTSAYGHRFDANNVGNLRRHWKIPCFRPSPEPAEGELMTVRKAAAALGVAPSTIHRALNDGAIVGEQFTAGAPWRIRLTNELRARFVDDAPSDYVTMCQAMRRLGVSRQTVWQRVKRGELEALHVTRGRQKGLRIKVMHLQSGLFDQLS
jgi:predicted DNA-binding transcriptional regulator AlpA